MPYFGLETGAGYYQSKWSESDSGVDAKLTVSAIPVTLTAKGFLPLGDKARLYAGAGIGVYIAKAKSEFEAAGISAESFSDNQSAFGYHAVLGGEFMVSSAVGLQAEAKWFKVEPEFSDDISDGKTDIGGIMISFGVLFQL